MSTDDRKQEGLPVWPESFPCEGDCGFEPRGVGIQCVTGSRCKHYLHPGDVHFREIDEYYKAVSRIVEEADRDK